MPHARTTDPITSHDAASKVKNITATQKIILAILEYPQTDEQLVKNYNALVAMDDEFVPRASESGIRSRRHELAELGKVVPVGYQRTPSRRYAIVWSAA